MRIDKFISNLWFWSRKEVAKIIKDMLVLVNWEYVSKWDEKIEFWDIIQIWEEEIPYKERICLALNKKVWYVSSRKDEWWHISFLNLVEDCPYMNLLNPAGRLDFDTSGLLILTNDWDLIHKITSPKKDVFKKYKVTLESDILEKDIKKLEKWVVIDVNWEKYETKESIAEKISDREIFLSIREGKFHQVKKMLEAVWNKVIALERISIWEISIEKISPWEWRYLDEKEIEYLIKN